MGCDECDGTNNHFGHGNQVFLYNGMTGLELAKKNITIDPWTPPAGTMVMTNASYAKLDIKPNCAQPKATPTVCDPRLRTMNVYGNFDIIFGPLRAVI